MDSFGKIFQKSNGKISFLTVRGCRLDPLPRSSQLFAQHPIAGHVPRSAMIDS